MKKIFEIKKEIKDNYGDIDIDYIFCEVLKISFSDLVQVTEIKEKDYKKIIKIAKKNVLKKEPLQKIFKQAYFYGRKFYVNSNVLTPRSDTENLCEEVLKRYRNSERPLKILDLCCGSGAIIITLCKELDNKINSYYASDISFRALRVAKKNAKTCKADINFIKSDMFKKINEKFDVIVSNPPYIKTKDINLLDDEVKNFDPKISLDGGADGLDFYKIIAENADKYLNENGMVFLEFGINQAKDLIKLFEKDYKDVKIVKDFNNIDRILIATRR